MRRQDEARVLRPTGLEAVGDVPWGSRVCHFYETRDDLLEILVAYFRAGLAGNELCLWLTSAPIDEETALRVLRREIPDIDDRLAAGDFEIVSHSRLYPEGIPFDPTRLLRFWEARHEDAIGKGRAGLRVNASEAWLAASPHSFADCQQQLDPVLHERKCLVLCAYDLRSRSAAEVFDLADAHHAVVARRRGAWSVLEAPEVVQAKQELQQRFDLKFEARVARRASEVTDALCQLRREMGHWSGIADALSESDQRFRELAEHSRDVFWIHTPDLDRALYVSPAYEHIWERPRAGGGGDRRALLETIHPEDRSRVATMLTCAPDGELCMEYRILTPSGAVRWIRDRRFPIRSMSGEISRFAGIAEDLTERKRAEQRLVEKASQLRALSAKVHMAREEEGARIAREIHDELGSVLTSLRWDLEGVQRDLDAGVANPVARISERLTEMLALSERAIGSVRRIASEMRPTLLDGLGLAEAIQWQVDQFEARSGIHCRCLVPVEPLQATREQSTAVFRILQEALTNVMKHARAGQVDVELAQRAGALLLFVRDDGQGLRAGGWNEDREPLGIIGMHERAQLLGGCVRLTSSPGCGTTLCLSLPLASADARSSAPMGGAE